MIAPIKSWVVSVVTWAVNAVENDLIAGVDFAAHVIEDVKNWAVSGFDFVAVVVENVYNALLSAINSAADFAAHVVETVVSWVSQGFSDIEGLVVQVVDDIWGAINAAASFTGALIDRAISDAEQYALDIARAVWSDGIDAFYQAVISPILGDIEGLAGEVGQVWAWFDTGVVDAWHVVTEAMDWLVWCAGHAFSDIESLWGDIGSQIDGVPDSIARYLESSDATDAIDYLTKNLGSL